MIFLRTSEKNGQCFEIFKHFQKSLFLISSNCVFSRHPSSERIICALYVLNCLNILCFNQGSCFIRTDQLDGETDWKLRIALPACQSLHSDQVYK